jgi:nucleoside-diphosphate-sugar epimerase
MRDLLKDKKIAVFGAGGLIGSALVRGALVQGATVIAVDLQSEQMIDVLSEASDDECQALSFVEEDTARRFLR